MFDSMGEIKCFLCSEIAEKLPHEGATSHVLCENCGEYIITLQAVRILELNHYDDIKYILSSQTFENYYYKQEPLTIKTEHIENAKDIPLLEKLYKLSSYLYHETKKTGIGSKIDDISYSQFYCRNDNEYNQLLETLKANNIIDIEKKRGPIADTRNFIYSPTLIGNAILAFEEGIGNVEDFKKVFMTTKNERNSYNFNINDGKNQFNLATDDAKISAVQNNSLAIAELNTLIENVIKSLPQNISDEQRNEVSENLAFIKTEIQSPNPRKTIIKNTLSVLKAIASTTAFLAALAKLVEFLQL